MDFLGEGCFWGKKEINKVQRGDFSFNLNFVKRNIVEKKSNGH